MKYTSDIFLDFRNELSSNMLVEAKIATQNENTISTTVTLHHYERPNWIFLGAGAITALLAVVTIFKSRR
jgi:membrane protein YdbS with pleckstrin-like domain